MIITYRKVCLAVGTMTGTASLIFLLGNLFFDKSNPYISIGLSMLSCFTLLNFYFKEIK